MLVAMVGSDLQFFTRDKFLIKSTAIFTNIFKQLRKYSYLFKKVRSVDSECKLRDIKLLKVLLWILVQINIDIKSRQTKPLILKHEIRSYTDLMHIIVRSFLLK